MSHEMQNIHNILAALLSEVDELKKENADLKRRLAKYETPKNSSNSSIPPSKDENRPRHSSLREKSGRKPGGQKGRKGNTLKMVSIPDITEKHIPGYCTCCGKDISNVAYEYAGKRQVIDIPEIKTLITEHQVFKKTCKCGHTTIGSYPSIANAPVSYGPNIESLVGYFHTRQYIPFKRMQEVFTDIFHLPISEGGIHYLLAKLVKKAQPAYELIKQKLKQNLVFAVGSDETGVKVDGQKYWAWTWQNDEATFISITDNRGEKSITGNFGHGFKKSVLVHDCWKSHFNTPALSHQICTAHLLRELNYLTERYNHKWSIVCKSILGAAIHLNNKLSDADYYAPIPQRTYLEKRLAQILEYQLPPNHKELVSFQKRLIKYRNYIFTFLYHPKVPPDNNASERAIRNIKVKQKVSGQFKSNSGGNAFAVLRSVTDTIIKNNQNVLSSLKVISNLNTD